MMFSIKVFTLLSSIFNLSLVNCLLCTSCTKVNLSFNNAEEIPSECEGKLVEADACQAIFRTNYLTKEIHLNLTFIQNVTRNYQLDLYAQNKFDDPEILNVNITYTCTTVFDCAQKFYQSTIQTLIRNEPMLKQIQAELYNPMAVNVEQCSDNQDQPVTCQNGYGCHGFEIIENGMTKYEGQCRNASTMTIFPRFYFSITLVQGDPYLATDWNHLGFTCNKKSLCNTREQINEMVKLANGFYPWKLIVQNSTTTTTTTTTPMNNTAFRDQHAIHLTIYGLLIIYFIVIVC